MNSKAYEADFPTEAIKEGRVKVLVPKLESYVRNRSDYAPSKAPVFYNPVMELNRDISVLAIQTYQRIVNKEINICEPLTSTGLRGVRYAIETQGIAKVLTNDINLRAANLAKQNIELNNVQDRVEVKHKDANCLLSCHSKPRQRFDVVDLDPFGPPVPYLDSAIRALRNNGLLALTATDLAPLCGVHEKACIRKYGGRPLRTEYCHELAIRLLTGCTATLAAKHDIGVRVAFCHSTDHYVRVYLDIDYGAKKADASIKSLGYVLHCFSCSYRETVSARLFKGVRECPECGSVMDYAGPLWLGSIFDKNFCESITKENTHRAYRNSARIAKLLSLTAGEAEAPPTYYVLDKLSNRLSLPVPPVTSILRALSESGFQALPTHFNSRGIRTDAPVSAINKLIRASFYNK